MYENMHSLQYLQMGFFLFACHLFSPSPVPVPLVVTVFLLQHISTPPISHRSSEPRARAEPSACYEVSPKLQFFVLCLSLSIGSWCSLHPTPPCPHFPSPQQTAAGSCTTQEEPSRESQEHESPRSSKLILPRRVINTQGVVGLLFL